MSALIDLTGMRFGLLTVLTRADKNAGRRVAWMCACDCGKLTNVSGSNLKRGLTQSCGHLYGEKHGMSKSGEYCSWAKMKQRCENVNNSDYAEWGGRGITVCSEWSNSFSQFFKDMGPRPSSRHSIDRIDNMHGYNQYNCRWATPKQQSRNTRRTLLVTAFGETKPMCVWVEQIGIPNSTLWNRLKRGVSPELALTRGTLYAYKMSNKLNQPSICH